MLYDPAYARFAKAGDTLVVDFAAGLLKNETQITVPAEHRMPDVMREIIGAAVASAT